MLVPLEWAFFRPNADKASTTVDSKPNYVNKIIRINLTPLNGKYDMYKHILYHVSIRFNVNIECKYVLSVKKYITHLIALYKHLV